MKKFRLVACLSALMLCGCPSSGVHPIGGGQYFVSEQSSQLLFGTPVLAENSAYQAAQEFCEKQGKSQVNTVNLAVQKSLLETPGHINLTFTCAQ